MSKKGIDNKDIKEITPYLIKMHKTHGLPTLKRAVNRYLVKESEKVKLEEEIREQRKRLREFQSKRK